MENSRFSIAGLCLALCLMFSAISSVLFAQVYPLDYIQQAVVRIEGSDREQGTGFVFFVSENKAYIMTAYHVVEKYDIPNENEFPVKFIFEDRNYSATVEWALEKIDLAILSLVEYPRNLRPLILGSSKDMEIGTKVCIYGYPGGYEIRRDEGSVSRRPGSDRIDLDDITPRKGNSGSPLLKDQTDKVVGMIIQKSEDVIDQYAIGIDDIKDYLGGIPIFSHIPTPPRIREMTPLRAIGLSAVVPGLSHHLLGHKARGTIYTVSGSGLLMASIGTYIYYRNVLADFEDKRVTENIEVQTQFRERALSARRLTVIIQALCGIAWGISVLDAGLLARSPQERELALRIQPTPDGQKFMLTLSF